MKKLFGWFFDNALAIGTLFLLVFIPLYPKLPLVDVVGTWVYVRAEDFVVFGVLFLWAVALIRNKITLRTPLTVPIFLFWIAGAIATLHGVLLIFPTLHDVYQNVAFLSFLRRIEYMSMFFVAFSATKGKGNIRHVIAVLAATLFLVTVYGIGQKYLGFPAFLTMNEEFAKGWVIRLSPLSRISSTFGGHYDFAAYLVLVVPIIASVLFVFRHWLLRTVLILLILLSAIAMFMTVSRISFLALVAAIALVLLFHKSKLVLVAIPAAALAAAATIIVSPTLLSRFGSTVKEIDVIVDAKTQRVIGHPREVPNTYFVDKVIHQQFLTDISDVSLTASASADVVIPYKNLPASVVLLTQPSAPTGEDLPPGTGYINLSLSPIKRKIGNFYYEPKKAVPAAGGPVFVINGNFLVRRVLTYDLSFTTRFQGGWPRTLAAFKRNVFFGSGYGSVGLAVDNSYLRMLGETGIFGFASFLGIFLIMAIVIRKKFSSLTDHLEKSFLVGFCAGLVGLAFNALFIDVFEASKVAFVLWILAGIAMGILVGYRDSTVKLVKELRTAISSSVAVVLSLFVVAILIYSPLLRNGFVGDDFTWFRWVSDCGASEIVQRCPPAISTIQDFFTNASGFFYRPGAKIYFLAMYWLFWLNQNAYHVVSLLLHFGVSVLVFFLAKKIVKTILASAAVAFLFLLSSGTIEAVHWISATGFLWATAFSLLSLLAFISWQEKRKTFLFSATLIFFVLALLFHELAIVTPLLYLVYVFVAGGAVPKVLFSPIPLYLIVRFLAGSHWFSGDYNYNLFKLPFNAVGNSLGYFSLALFGPASTPFYSSLRNLLRDNILIAVGAIALLLPSVFYTGKQFFIRLQKDNQKAFLFGLLFFLASLLPFLGLGNMSSRYGYVAAIGVMFMLVVFLKNLYTFLLGNGRAIALLGITITVSSFSLFQLIQQQQLHSDWYEAGEKTKRFINSIAAYYEDEWTTQPIEIHLVNVPIRMGEAWVFPVGIDDALFLIFRNQQMKIYKWPSLLAAFDAVSYNSQTQRVFMFDRDGNVTEQKKVKIAQ